MVGTVPLIIHTAINMPISERIKIGIIADCMPCMIEDSSFFQENPYRRNMAAVPIVAPRSGI